MAHDYGSDFYGDTPQHQPSYGVFYENVKAKHSRTWEDIEAARVALFEEGSVFKPTERHEVVGIDKVMDRIDRVVHWLKHSEEYLRLNARIEPGIILEGEPGTGKTLVSRYIATASGAFFVNVRDWPHKGTLFTDTDIRDLFQAARAKYADTRQPIILFWDEFENGAVERSNATPEQVATVSQLTAELDGVHGKNEGLLLIGCTNYANGIDAALRRPGRMGLHIEFHAPDRLGKRRILTHYLDQFPTEGALDTETLSFFFDPGATAATIEESCIEAWTHAVHRSITQSERAVLTQQDLIDVFLKRLVGPPTAFVDLSVSARLRVSIHEVGHALTAITYGIPLRLITVQAGKKSLGRTMTHELEDHISTVDEMLAQMKVGLGSIAAERITGTPSMLGSMGDVADVNTIASKLVDRLDVGRATKLFNVTAVSSVRDSALTSVHPNISNEYVRRGDHDVEYLLNDVMAAAEDVMRNIGAAHVLQIAEVVNRQITLTGAEFCEAVSEITGVTDFAVWQA